jgi:hypothetical protein
MNILRGGLVGRVANEIREAFDAADPTAVTGDQAYLVH